MLQWLRDTIIMGVDAYHVFGYDVLQFVKYIA